MYDILIQGGSVLDGAGNPPFDADIAIEKGRIRAIGHNLGKAKTVIDATGKTVTPGFIDIHRHADAAVFREDFGELELSQGLTTIINGNCGLSVCPIDGAFRQSIVDYLDPITGPIGEDVPTDSLDRYLRSADHRAIHTGMLVGEGSVRASVAGFNCTDLNADQVKSIQKKLETALADGVFGVSLGLGYAPDCFASTEDLIELLAPLRSSGVPITVHMRQEGDGVCEAAEEMISIAKALNTPLEISHLKGVGKRNWNKAVPRTIEIIEAAQRDGVDVRCDVYPYTAGSTQLIHILPAEFLKGGTEGITARLRDPEQREILRERLRTGTDFENIAGMMGWDNILCSTLNLPENKKYEGMSIAAIAEDMGKDPFHCACDLLVAEQCSISMIDFIAADSDMERILKLPYSSVISDSTYPTTGKRHPRVYGSFARVIETYVYEKKLLTLPEAIASMTSLPADAMRISGKGRIAVGMDADILVFDPEKLHEVGTYQDPARYATGMDWVLVDGVPAIERGKLTGSRSGRSLRRHG